MCSSKSDHDQRTPPEAIRPDPEGNLHQGLGQAVGADREPGQQRRSARQRARVQGEHRQQQEQPEHPDRVDAASDSDGAAFGGQERRASLGKATGNPFAVPGMGAAILSGSPRLQRRRMTTIQIRGARTHNLQGIDLDLPRDRLIVFTGLSGSGKSSLAFDTIYAEGQRRYVESLSAYARQFLSMMEKPDVDSIEGLSPAISIEQKSTSHNPRSTVGTVTEIYDYLRLLYARAGIPRCPDHGLDLTAQTVSQMVDQVLALPEGTPLALLAPVIAGRKGEHLQVIEELRGKGFVRARVDGKLRRARRGCRNSTPSASTRSTRSWTASRCAPTCSSGSRNPSRPRSGSARASRASRSSRNRSARNSCSRTSSPARSAAIRCPNWSRGCSRSTTRPAPAPAATVSA